MILVLLLAAGEVSADRCFPPATYSHMGCPGVCSHEVRARIYEGTPAEYQLDRLGGMPELQLRKRPVFLEVAFSGGLGVGLLALLLALTTRRSLKVAELPEARQIGGSR